MLFEVDKDIWFDNDSIKIFKGEERTACLPEPATKHVPSVQDVTWRPTVIFLAATTCNLKCKYCYADEGTYGENNKKKQFKVQDYIDVYDKMWKIHGGIKAISFFGGEPLINFNEIRKFVEYLHLNYKREEIPRLSINTNGTILSEDILEFLKKYRFIVGTSIDGTKEVHDANRIGDAFKSTYEVVTQNIKRLVENGNRIYVQCTFTKQHLDNYEPGRARQWCEEMEALPINTYEIIPVSSNDVKYRIDLSDEGVRNKYRQFCEEIADYYIYKILGDDIKKVPRMFIGLIIRLLMQVEQHECTAGHSFSVTPDKVIFPCHTFTELKEYGIGITDINTYDDMRNNAFFSKVKDANRDKNDRCRKCLASKICGVWCKGLQNSITGDMTHELEERCVMMDIFTKKIIRFLATEYLLKHKEINGKLVEYNKYHQ